MKKNKKMKKKRKLNSQMEINKFHIFKLINKNSNEYIEWNFIFYNNL